MSEPISVECPMCGVPMRLNDRSKLGKKAACPNCSNLFVLAETPATAVSAGSGASAGARIRAIESNPGGRSTGAGLVVVGVAALLLLAVGVGLWGSGVFSGGGTPQPPVDRPIAPADGQSQQVKQNVFDLSYLPADAELFVRLKLADAWEAPLLTDLVGTPAVKQFLKEMRETIGLTPGDIESLTIGLAGLSEQSRPGVERNPEAAAAAAREQFLGVFRTTRDVNAASLRLIENGCRKLEHAGRAYYLFQPETDDSGGEAAKPLALFLAAPRLTVIGSEAQVQGVIESGGKQSRRAELDFVEPDRQLLVVVVPRDKSAFTGTISPGGPGDPAGEMARVALKQIEAVSIGVDLGAGIDLAIQADCADENAAGEIQRLALGLIAEGRGRFEKSRGEMMFGLGAALEPVLQSLEVSQEGSTVTLRAEAPEQTIASVKPFAGLFLLGMTGGGSGGDEVEKTEAVGEPVEAPVPGEESR